MSKHNVIAILLGILLLSTFVASYVFSPVSDEDKHCISKSLSSDTQQLIIKLRKILAGVLFLPVIIWMTSFIVAGYYAEHVDRQSRAVKLKMSCNLFYYSSIFVIAFTVIGFILIMPPLYEFMYISLHWKLRIIKAVVILVIYVYFLYIYKPWLDYFRSNKTAMIVSSFFLKQRNKFAQSNEKQKALESTIKACEHSPESAFLWSHLASDYLIFNRDIERSDECLRKAKLLIDSSEKPDDKDLAEYEFALSLFLFRQKQDGQALKHLSRSIELCYNESRQELYNKLSEEIRKQENSNSEL